MKISINTMQKLSKIKNSVYDDIKIEYLYHSNKLEGSTFNVEQLNILLEQKVVTGEHSIDDVQETINSLELFDFVINTLNEQLTPMLLREYHSILKKNTSDANYGFVGVYKKIPNKLRSVNIELSQPYEVLEQIERLLEKKIETLKDIADFHQKFEHIHPFQDGNGRLGRMWHSLLLGKWKELFYWLPVEELIQSRQNEYYETLGRADKEADSFCFVELMLEMICCSLTEIQIL